MIPARSTPIRCLGAPLRNPGPKGPAEPVDRRQEDALSAVPTSRLGQPGHQPVRCPQQQPRRHPAPSPEPPSASRARPGDADRVRADPTIVIARAKHRVAACCTVPEAAAGVNRYVTATSPAALMAGSVSRSGPVTSSSAGPGCTSRSNPVGPGCHKIYRQDEGPDRTFGEPVTASHCVAALTARWPFHMDVGQPKETAGQRLFWHCLNRHKQPKRRGPNHTQSPDAAPGTLAASLCQLVTPDCAQHIGQPLRIVRRMALGQDDLRGLPSKDLCPLVVDAPDPGTTGP